MCFGAKAVKPTARWPNESARGPKAGKCAECPPITGAASGSFGKQPVWLHKGVSMRGQDKKKSHSTFFLTLFFSFLLFFIILTLHPFRLLRLLRLLSPCP